MASKTDHHHHNHGHVHDHAHDHAAVARDDGFEVFSHPDRVIGAKVGDAVR